MKNTRQYTVVIKQDEDGFFVASVPALPGCHTQARTMPELHRRLREVIGLCLEVAKKDSRYRQNINFVKPMFIGLDMITA